MLSILSDLFGGKKILALDIGTSSIKLAEIDHSGRGPVLRKFAVYPINPGVINGGEVSEVTEASQAIEGLLQISGSKRKFVATGIWGNAVIVKKISMPRMEAALVSEQIKWEAEQYIPFDVNEVSLEHHILTSNSQSSESMEVLLVAAKQDLLFRMIETIESAKLKCSVIDVSGFALANCFEVNYGSFGAPIVLLNIGAGVTNFVVILNGEVVFCRDIPVGGWHFTYEIHKSMGVSFTEAEALKISASLGQEVPAEVNNILTSTLEQVAEEIKNSFEFYSSTGGGSISKFYVSGGSMYLPGLVEATAKAVNVPFEVFDPFNKITFDSKVFSAEQISQIRAISPVALGLALRKLNEK